MFPVWFACNTCRGSFQKLDDFLTHKKQHHFEEFQNTKCIIFEERRIKCIEQTVSFSPTPQDFEEANPHGLFDPLKVKVNNENKYDDDRTNNLQLPCKSIANLEICKTKHQSSDQDFAFDEGVDIDCCNPVKCVEAAVANNSNLKNTSGASNLNTISANGADFELSKSYTKTQHNQPIVLVKRLTSQEIQNLTVSLKNFSIVKSSAEPDSNSTVSKASNKCSEKIVSTFSPCKINANEETNADSKKLKQCENSPIEVLHDSNVLQSHEYTPTTNNEENRRPKRERPFECQYCGASFFQKYAIAEHLTWHATEETFKCVITKKYRNIPKTKNNFRLLTRIPSRSGNKQRFK